MKNKIEEGYKCDKCVHEERIRPIMLAVALGGLIGGVAFGAVGVLLCAMICMIGVMIQRNWS